MKRFMSALAAGSFVSFVVYLAFVFAASTFDINQWSDGYRAFCAFAMVIVFAPIFAEAWQK
jgi:uncharacterized membrane protein